jgi:glucose/arabinose dehydrogenase
MKLLSPVVLIFLLAVLPAGADALPGFRVETLGSADGFVSSVAVDSKANIYFTTTDGWIHRLDDGNAVRVASLPTRAGGNGGLLGMALLDDRTAVVHYTTWAPSGEKVLDDVISTVDLVTGTERVLQSFACDIHFRDNGASSEHHGGNPTVAPDGSIFVGIGEYGGRIAAQKPEWNGGKIFRIDRDGRSTQWALGMRNPYDLAWDDDLGQVVVADNGPNGGDEIHVIDRDANCGWPDTYGNEPQISDSVAPVYVFDETVAPTGLARLNGANDLLRSGYLLAAFVTRAIYYFPNLAERPVAEPVAVINGYESFIIDVIQAPDGTIYFASAEFPGTSSIHRLVVPQRGDCNGDGFTDSRDITALVSELRDGRIQPMTNVQNSAHPGSWGCDVTSDGIVDSRDLDQLAAQLMRKRSVRR